MRNSMLLSIVLVAITLINCKPPLPIKLTKIKQQQNKSEDFVPITTNEDKKFVLPPAVFDACAVIRCRSPYRCVDGECTCNFKCPKRVLPFCDDDGNEYRNMCEVKKQMCKSGTEFFYLPGKCLGRSIICFLYLSRSRSRFLRYCWATLKFFVMD